MGIRTIRTRMGKEIAGFQAFAGAGGPGATKFFSATRHGVEGARKLAEEHERALKAAHKPPSRRGLRGNAGGIPGVRFQYQQHTDDGTPVLYAVTSWVKSGRLVQRQRSTDKHGLLGAVSQVLALREKAAGPTGLTPRQALARMQRALRGH